MPDYLYSCHQCGEEVELSFPIGTAQRMMACDCGDKLRLVIGYQVQIAPSMLISKGEQVRDADAREARWNRDIPAYQRMRAKGMQPPQIDGSAALEDKADDQLDIDYSRFYDQGVTKERVLESKEQAAEIMANGLAR